jgi:hypothetical protein
MGYLSADGSARRLAGYLRSFLDVLCNRSSGMANAVPLQ